MKPISHYYFFKKDNLFFLLIIIVITIEFNIQKSNIFKENIFLVSIKYREFIERNVPIIYRK